MLINSPEGCTTLAEPFARAADGKPLIRVAADRLYGFGHLVRITEQLILDLFGQGRLSGTTHTCLGQELCQMAVVRALQHPRDVVLSNHRNHGHFLTYSGDFLGLLGEVMGREAGVCRGRGGSQHIAYRHFHSNGVQAGMSAIGVGEALTKKWEADGSIVVAVVGDGTLGEGLLYESLNLASIWHVPMLFVVERNHVAQTTPTSETIGGSVQARGDAFGHLTWKVDDTDTTFFGDVEAAVDTVRRTGHPGFLVIDTRRMGPHSKGDDPRTPEEFTAIRARDPLAALGATLGAEVRSELERANVAFLREVMNKAGESPLSTYSTPPAHAFERPARPMPRVPEADASPGTVRAVLNRSLRRLLEEDPRVVLLGEDLHDPYGGAFKVTRGLSTAFPGRVISTPISEAAVVGAGIGLALAGYRPIVEVMFADFLTLAADQLYNQAVKFSALFPSLSVPLVIRTPSGGRRGYGPTHSQSPENIFVSFPGLTVVFPSHRHDSDRLLTPERGPPWFLGTATDVGVHAARLSTLGEAVQSARVVVLAVPASAADRDSRAPRHRSTRVVELETESVDAMRALLSVVRRLPIPFVVFTVHSSSLIAKGNPYSASEARVREIWSSADRVLADVNTWADFRPATVAEIGEALEAQYQRGS